MVRIPSGATSIDIRQHAFHNHKEDNNYLGECEMKLRRMKTNVFRIGVADAAEQRVVRWFGGVPGVQRAAK